PGKPATEPPRAWAVVVGVSRYHGGALDLRFAAKDAEDFARGLRVAAGRLFGKDQVRLHLLTTAQAGAGRQPTRANLTRAFQAARASRPGDVLVVYLAGHGVNHGGPDGDFFFL